MYEHTRESVAYPLCCPGTTVVPRAGPIRGRRARTHENFHHLFLTTRSSYPHLTPWTCAPFFPTFVTKKMTSERDDIAGLVVYEPEYGIVICRPCRHAIKPGDGVRRHLKRKHESIVLATR